MQWTHNWSSILVFGFPTLRSTLTIDHQFLLKKKNFGWIFYINLNIIVWLFLWHQSNSCENKTFKFHIAYLLSWRVSLITTENNRVINNSLDGVWEDRIQQLGMKACRYERGASCQARPVFAGLGANVHTVIDILTPPRISPGRWVYVYIDGCCGLNALRWPRPDATPVLPEPGMGARKLRMKLGLDRYSS